MDEKKQTPEDIGAECFAEDLATTGERACDIRCEDWWDGSDVMRALELAGLPTTDAAMQAWGAGYSRARDAEPGPIAPEHREEYIEAFGPIAAMRQPADEWNTLLDDEERRHER